MKTLFYLSGTVLLSMILLASCKESVEEAPASNAVTLADVDVSAYDQWVYLSFASGTPVFLGVDEEAPTQWDIALHRENVKTNHGAALKSDATSLAALTELPSGDFVSDVMDSIIVDMSQMMQGVIIYQESEINPVLNAWVGRSGMPPVYTVKNNVYVVRNKEGRYAKIKFSSYNNAADGKSGFATFSYVFPAFE